MPEQGNTENLKIYTGMQAKAGETVVVSFDHKGGTDND